MLQNGSVLFSGNTFHAVDFYLNSSRNNEINKVEKSQVSEDNQFITIYNSDSENKNKTEYKFDEELVLATELYIPKWIPSLELAISLYDKHKRRVFTIHEPLIKHYSGNKVLKFKVTIPSRFLTPGNYSWLMCINHPGNLLYDLQDDVCAFSIVETGSEFSRYGKADYGCVFVDYKIKNII